MKRELIELGLELYSKRERESFSPRHIERPLIQECGVSLAKAGAMVNGLSFS